MKVLIPRNIGKIIPRNEGHVGSHGTLYFIYVDSPESPQASRRPQLPIWDKSTGRLKKTQGGLEVDEAVEVG